jgi:hypothetical protein
VPDDVRVVALGEGDPDGVAGSPAPRVARLLATAGASATSACRTRAREGLAGNSVTVAIETIWIAPRPAVIQEEALSLSLG